MRRRGLKCQSNGTELHGQSIVLGYLWKEDSTFGGRIFMSGTHSVHGYRSQHLHLNGQIGEQYLVDGLVVWDDCYLTPRSRRSMFYLTLPSNSSMNYCANNTLTHYTTKFPKITEHGKSDWQRYSILTVGIASRITKPG